MSKLRAQARRVKEVLSANQDTPIYIESAYKEIDFKGRIEKSLYSF